MVISTANGLKFPNFKIHYHADTAEDLIEPPRPELSVTPRLRNRPIRVAADLDAVRRVIEPRLAQGEQ